MKFNRLGPCADQLMWFKYVVKNVARKHGKAATFMPKPLFGDNGSGMHVHQSLWKEGKPLFGGDGYAGLSDTRASLHRRHHQARQVDRGADQPDDQLVPAPGARLRGAGEPRVLEPQPLGERAHPHHRAQPQDAPHRGALPRSQLQPVPRVQRPCSWRASTASRTRSTPAIPMDKDIYALSPEELKDVPQMPGSLDEALRHAGARPRVLAARRRLHQGRPPRVARVQADQGAQPDPHAADALRVLPLLRHLKTFARVPALPRSWRSHVES